MVSVYNLEFTLSGQLDPEDNVLDGLGNDVGTLPGTHQLR